MFLIIVTVIFVLGDASSNESQPDYGLNLEACDFGDVVENDCSKCICTARYLFDCTSKGCPETNDSDENQANIKSRSCHPHKIYNLDGTICICNPDGLWPHKACHSIFQSLPSAKIVKQKCIPDSYVVIDCNICRCNDKGQIDNERCTKNECDDVSKGSEHRRNSKKEQVYGKCKAKNWYSFAPCQFCYCLNNNKLMCNTGAENRSSVKLGSYKFSVCGTELLKQALELTPDGKEASNVLRIGKHRKDETTIEAADQTGLGVIDLEMGEDNNKNNEDDDGSDEVERQDIRVKTTKSQIENTESQDYAESEDGSDKEAEKFTQHPYADSDNREKDTDNGGGRTEDRDDKDNENNSEDASEESLPIKPPVKSAEEHEPEKISIKFVGKQPTKEKMASKKEKKSSKLAGKKEANDKETVEFDLGKAIQNNLPMVFSKVLSSLRKTVSLDSTTDCEPGTRLVVKCNVCHCLKNKKMVCTNNKC